MRRRFEEHQNGPKKKSIAVCMRLNCASTRIIAETVEIKTMKLNNQRKGTQA